MSVLLISCGFPEHRGRDRRTPSSREQGNEAAAAFNSKLREEFHTKADSWGLCPEILLLLL